MFFSMFFTSFMGKDFTKEICSTKSREGINDNAKQGSSLFKTYTGHIIFSDVRLRFAVYEPSIGLGPYNPSIEDGFTSLVMYKENYVMCADPS